MAKTYRHVTPSGAGVKDGTTWAKAMGWAEFVTSLTGSMSTDWVYFLKGGTYTATGNVDASGRSASSTTPAYIIGVLSATTNEGAAIVYTDFAINDTDRPFLDLATYQLKLGTYIKVYGIRFEGEKSIVATQYVIFNNCKFNNDIGSSSTNYTVELGNYSGLINCQLESVYAKGVSVDLDCWIMFCYFKGYPDTTNGSAIVNIDSGCIIFGNIFYDCFVAINNSGSSYAYQTIMNNTFYACATDISQGTSIAGLYINNLHEGTTTVAYTWSSQRDQNFFWKNHGNDTRCTDMWNNVDSTSLSQDYEISTGDPLFSNPGVDHKLETGSPCLNTGISISLGV